MYNIYKFIRADVLRPSECDQNMDLSLMSLMLNFKQTED